MRRRSITLAGIVVVFTLSACAGAKRPSLAPASDPGATLWRQPSNLAAQDLYHGPWGARHAPDPNAVYTLVERKHSGVNLGMTVVDPQGREWSVKQPYPSDLDDEAPVEVTLSRLLSALGYHQPPVYHLRSFTLQDDWGTHVEAGGRFRLKEESLKETGSWRWDENPFVGTKPYQGLVVLMMMFNNTDLKNSNNSLYEYTNGRRTERWYVVRDIGASMGDTHRWVPRKNHPASFEQHPFILGVRGGFVDFAHDGWYRRLVEERITPDDVMWVSNLMAGLTERQWRDAFRAGGYEPKVADRFIRALREKVRAGQNVTRRATAR